MQENYNKQEDNQNKDKRIFVENSKIAQNVSHADQIAEQYVLTEDGRSINLDEKHFTINEKGERILDEDGETLKELAKKQLTYKDFVTACEEDARKALLILLSMQSNKAPLKAGGEKIAYMADLLLDHMMIDFSEEAVLILEALSARQSSNPEDDFFTLTPDDLRPYTNYESDEALYHAFKKGCNEVNTKEFKFDIPDPDRDGHYISVPWKKGAHWCGYNRKTKEKAKYEVITNDFYRALMSSSGILHGAHWNRLIAKTLKGYAKSLYIFCARNWQYQKYHGAIEGRKELTVEEARYELNIDKKIENKAVWRRLQEAQEKVNNLPDSEFSVKITKIPEKGKIQGFRFDIKRNKTDKIVDENPPVSAKISEDPLFNQIKTLSAISDLEFSDEEVAKITQVAKEFGKDGKDMMQILADYKTKSEKKDIKYPHRYIRAVLEKKKNDKKNNAFGDFAQNTYDFEELEKKLLDN